MIIVVKNINVKRPPRGVASFLGLVWSSTLWFILNKSTVCSIRLSRALKPVVSLAVREKATRKARRNSQEKITTQARRDWEEVVGRGTPKKTVEVAAEGRVVIAADIVNDARAGQARKGEVGVPLPCASALGAPLADASPLKLYRGREVKPGQKEVPSQGVQDGTVPIVPLAQPKQERLVARAKESEP